MMYAHAYCCITLFGVHVLSCVYCVNLHVFLLLHHTQKERRSVRRLSLDIHVTTPRTEQYIGWEGSRVGGGVGWEGSRGGRGRGSDLHLHRCVT